MSLADVPVHWVAMVRPFYQRADEFQSREPLVSYFLRTHIAFLCLQKRTKEDKEGVRYLLKLLDALEAEKQRLGAALDGVDGRTLLTRIALMLFARADDEERSGSANLSVVRLFYSSSVLFEATEQFTEDGKMDNIAAEKCRYAKYTAAKMKKALDSNEPYVSPNKIEASLNADAAAAAAAAGGSDGSSPQPMLTTAPPSAYMHRNQNMNSTNGSNSNAAGPQLGAPPMPYAQAMGGGGGQPAYQQQQQQQQNHASPPPPQYNPPPFTPPPPAAAAAGRGPAVPAPTHQQQYSSSGSNNITNVSPQKAAPAPPPPAATGYVPSAEEMIDAQKHARQVVSALQFYDHKTARQQLLTALDILDGRKKKM